VEELCAQQDMSVRRPGEGDLFLACCDALIAAQNAVVAAESFGIGSCYIGDILEQYEFHRELFQLPQYAIPIGLLVFGYPTQAEKDRQLTSRFKRNFVVYENQYHQLTPQEFEEMFAGRARYLEKNPVEGIANPGQAIYMRKYSAAFTLEMNRSVRAMLQEWMK
jgi:FMN reductase (NADPH)/FMN reductase [NAD(P)H]